VQIYEKSAQNSAFNIPQQVTVFKRYNSKIP